MKTFIKNLIEQEGGLNQCFLNSCFIDAKQLCFNIQKFIHFQTTYIDEEKDNALILTLDYGSFTITLQLDLSASNCDAKYYTKKINKITCIEYNIIEKD